MEVKKYVIDLSLSDRLEELKDSFFEDIAFVKYSDHKAVVESKDKEIQVLETTLNFRDESIVKMQKTIDQYEESQNESNRFAQLLMSEKKELQNKIDELEKLKCCGNCDEEPEKGNYKEICHSCTRNMNYQNPECCEDNWIAKGIK